MYEVQIRVIGYKGVTKHLYRTEASALRACSEANTSRTSATWSKLF